MKEYYLSNTHDTLTGREEIEWSNIWYSKSNIDVKRRILLIGDSTARMVRSTFEEKAGCAVDLFGCSYGLHDILFVDQLNTFFSSCQYRYDTIFVQLGHHSRINDKGQPYTENDYNIFRDDMNALVDFLKSKASNVILLSIFYSVIPLNCGVNNVELNKIYNLLVNKVRRREKYDDSINEIKQMKNQIIKEIASNHQIHYIDINQMILDRASNRRSRYVHIDHIHFENKAKYFIVEQYLKHC